MELKLSEAEKQIRWLRRKEELLEKVLDAICENELDGSVCSRTQAKRTLRPLFAGSEKRSIGRSISGFPDKRMKKLARKDMLSGIA